MRDPSMGPRRERTREARGRRRTRRMRVRLVLIAVVGAVIVALVGLTVLNTIERNRRAAAAYRDSATAGNKAAARETATVEAARPAPGELEQARDRYLQRSPDGQAPPAAGSGAPGLPPRDGPGEAEAGEASEAEKERVLRQLMPYYRSPKKRDAPAVPADELYIPDPSKARTGAK